MTNETPAVSSCCSTSSVSADTEVEGVVDVAIEAADDMTTCPVMVGTPTSKSTAEAKGLYRDYGGNRYWLCCPGCGPAFDADPARYAANMA